ncbi:MAG: FAD-dependent oxidoreductase [Acetobacteraceae bacterium]|nr:FAD-dependent oxidoreductase [Acetobacteraceae bacterium]
MRRAHIIGAGLAGLSAALVLAETGAKVTIYEAGPAAGGRCRSYYDRTLGLSIDNGNHLLLSGNTATMRLLERTGARSTLIGPPVPLFPFIDLHTRQRWTLRPNMGRVPWWILNAARRVPATSVADYLPLLSLPWRRGDATVAASFVPNQLYRRLLEPLAIAALNTPPSEGLARLLGAVVRETLGRGGAACIPLLPREELSQSLIDPAVERVRNLGADFRPSSRISRLDFAAAADRVSALHGPDGPIPLGPDESVVLAVPPWVATELLPGLTAPDEFQAILNIHFRIDAARGETGFIGLIGGNAEWVFVKPGHVSVTISAANRMVDQSAEAIAGAVWPDVCLALSLPATPKPIFRVVKERRATFAATAAQERRRPGPATKLANLVLAGDWTATGLPATIEGAIRSGERAAALLLRT